METIDKAMAILAEEPLPADAFQRIEALERAATADERPLFADIWEGYYAAGGEDPD
jgi:hypothetical protein